MDILVQMYLREDKALHLCDFMCSTVNPLSTVLIMSQCLHYAVSKNTNQFSLTCRTLQQSCVSCYVQYPAIAQSDEICPSLPSMCVCALVRQCQLCCFEQKSCQEVKEVGSGSNLRPTKTDKPQQQSCQDASFGTTVSQHTSLEPDLGHSCRSAWASKSDPSTLSTSAVWQELASKFVNQASKCGTLPVEYCTSVMTRY